MSSTFAAIDDRRALSLVVRLIAHSDLTAKQPYQNNPIANEGDAMRRILLIAVGLLVASPAWADIESDKRECIGGSGQTKLSACSRLIQSGHLSASNKPVAYNSRGNAYLNQKQYRRAIQDYSEALRLNPKYALAFYNRGVAYGNLKKLRRAIQDYDAAIRLNPRYANAYYNRGNIYRDLKQYRRAIQDYNQAIRLNPKIAFAYNNRGLAYSNLKQYNRAIQDFNEAVRLNARFANAYGNRGLAYEKLGQKQFAIRDYRMFLSIYPGHRFGMAGLKRLGVKP